MQTARRWSAPAILAVALALTVVAALAVQFGNQARTLMSFRQVGEYPLYVMHLYGSYLSGSSLPEGQGANADLQLGQEQPAPWACTTFAALGEGGDRILGRNFDWHHRPTLLLFTHPPDGYASVSMVDIHYLGFDTEKPTWGDRGRLLDAARLPFDGLNEHGLAVGMMAVPHAEGGQDPQKATVDSLFAMRLILDGARTVDEAVALLQAYNVDFGGGPPLHYLMADAWGNSAVIEFSAGEMQVLRNEEPWQVATNFLLSGTTADGAKQLCWRYATAYEALEQAKGVLSAEEAMDLLEDVSQPLTVWSVVYDMSSGGISVAMGRQYDHVHQFELHLPDR